MTKLLPCPFCGGDAELIRGEEAAAAQCLQVKAHRLVMTGDNNIAEEVAEHWNRRPLLKSVKAFAAVFDDVSPRICDLDPEDRQRLWSAYAELGSLTIVGGGA